MFHYLFRVGRVCKTPLAGSIPPDYLYQFLVISRYYVCPVANHLPKVHGVMSYIQTSRPGDISVRCILITSPLINRCFLRLLSGVSLWISQQSELELQVLSLLVALSSVCFACYVFFVPGQNMIDLARAKE